MSRPRDRATAVWPAFAELRWARRCYRILDYERECEAWLAERRRLLALVEAKRVSTDRKSQTEAKAATRRLRAIDTDFAPIKSFVDQLITDLPRRRIESPFRDEPAGPEWVLEKLEGPTAFERLYTL